MTIHSTSFLTILENWNQKEEKQTYSICYDGREYYLLKADSSLSYSMPRLTVQEVTTLVKQLLPTASYHTKEQSSLLLTQLKERISQNSMSGNWIQSAFRGFNSYFVTNENNQSLKLLDQTLKQIEATHVRLDPLETLKKDAFVYLMSGFNPLDLRQVNRRYKELVDTELLPRFLKQITNNPSFKPLSHCFVKQNSLVEDWKHLYKMIRSEMMHSKSIATPVYSKLSPNTTKDQLTEFFQAYQASELLDFFKILNEEYYFTHPITDLLISKKSLEEIIATGQEITLWIENNKLAIKDLEVAYLNHIPKEIGCLIHLTNLDISNNRLRELPAELSQLTQLQSLLVCNNLLAEFPSVIGKLVNLKFLDLSSNKLTKISSVIGELTQLKELHLKHNQIKQCCEEIIKLVSLTSLDFGNNQLKSISIKIPPDGSKPFKHLTKLILSSNELEHFPLDLCQLDKLEILFLFNNKIQTIPLEVIQMANLRQLFLSGNKIDVIPDEISQMKHLTIFERIGDG